jgi:hypothetical protein
MLIYLNVFTVLLEVAKASHVHVNDNSLAVQAHKLYS